MVRSRQVSLRTSPPLAQADEETIFSVVCPRHLSLLVVTRKTSLKFSEQQCSPIEPHEISLQIPKIEAPDHQYWRAAVGYGELGMFQEANDQRENCEKSPNVSLSSSPIFAKIQLG